MRYSFIPQLSSFVLGIALTCIVFYYWNSKQVDLFDDKMEYVVDSTIAVYAHEIDSIRIILDSNQLASVRIDTVIIKIRKYEKVSISFVDAMHRDSVIIAIKGGLHY
jgi:hypothetical protein|tara:strand:- start:8108 stop:8428 length:321 start_codon:yes stop_codon:yes gene_type:complete